MPVEARSFWRYQHDKKSCWYRQFAVPSGDGVYGAATQDWLLTEAVDNTLSNEGCCA